MASRHAEDDEDGIGRRDLSLMDDDEDWDRDIVGRAPSSRGWITGRFMGSRSDRLTRMEVQRISGSRIRPETIMRAKVSRLRGKS